MSSPPPCRRRTFALVLLACCLCPASRAPAQEVEWRPDYASARREAVEKNRPLMIDFRTTHCPWCDKLDSVVFHDPSIVGLLNERFVSLTVDAEREVRLASDLNVQTYPTVVLAGADGRILDVQVGFLDAPRFQEKLQRALTAVSVPEWMTRDYEAAARAIAGADYARAIALLRALV